MSLQYHSRSTISPPALPAENQSQTWRTAIYARISHLSDHTIHDSIESQIALARQYLCQHPDLNLVCIQSDINQTGTNFNRPGFQHLLEQSQTGIIQCLIVKDFSRLGRNYLETGNYLERIFPELGLRFISINDHYDSLEESTMNKALSIQIQNLVNDLYAKDISQRVRSAKQQIKQSGGYIGVHPPYGFQITHQGALRTLIPDPKTHPIYQKIHALRRQGYSLSQISTTLTAQRLTPPSLYRQTQTLTLPLNTPPHPWNRTTLQNLLKRPPL